MRGLLWGERGEESVRESGRMQGALRAAFVYSG